MKRIEDLISFCKEKTVWIQMHNYPDQDAIASAFGMQYLLQQFGISSKICYEGQIDKLSSQKLIQKCKIEMYALVDIAEEQDKDDVIILVDCQKDTSNTTDFIGEEVAVIDHHPISNDVVYRYDNRQLVGACASLVANYYKELAITPSKEVATALLYGLKMDTAQFARGVTAFDIEMYSFLFQHFDDKILKKLETNNMEFNDLRAYGAAINNIQIYGKVGLTFVDFICSEALIAILSDFILSLNEVDVAVVWALRKGGYKFSVRSEKSDVNAGILIKKTLENVGDGGGHAFMAGGFLPKKSIEGLDEQKSAREVITQMFITTIARDYPELFIVH